MEQIERVRRLLDESHFMSLATASKNAVPWGSPIFFGVDEDLVFYWLSSPEAQHSKNIHANPLAFITIYDSTRRDWDGFGVYFSTRAEKIDETDLDALAKAHETCFKKAGRSLVDPSVYTGDYPRKYYRATVEEAWINDIEQVNGVDVDIRKRINLASLY